MPAPATPGSVGRPLELIEPAVAPTVQGRAWFARWRELVGDDLLGGYGTLCHPAPERMRRFNEQADGTETHR